MSATEKGLERVDILISPMATPTASEPSATTKHLHPSRMSSVSMIFAVMGLSSASRQVTTLSFGSGALRKSIECTDDAGVLVSSFAAELCPTEDV